MKRLARRPARPRRHLPLAAAWAGTLRLAAKVLSRLLTQRNGNVKRTEPRRAAGGAFDCALRSEWKRTTFLLSIHTMNKLWISVRYRYFRC